MTLGVFGPAVDILAGGADLDFPHHAYQAAIVEAVTGVGPFARAGLPVGTVTVDGAKMAKSAGNLVLVSDVLAGHSAPAVRLMLLSRPWRETWDFGAADLDTASARLEQLYAAAGTAQTSPAAASAVTAALVNDLDVNTALRIGEESGGVAARLVLHVLALE